MAEAGAPPSLEARVARLEDLAAIQDLKARCCLCVDRMDREGFATLFTDDGVFAGVFQKLEGRAALRDVAFWPFMVHFVANPMIAVAGSQASGVWYFLRAYTTPDGRPHWAAGLYHDQYVKDGEGRWRFKSVTITNFFVCPHETGWQGAEAD